MDADTGIAAIGEVGWGTHVCHFYRTAEDLEETLVPFFKAGLESNEACLWVTAPPFGKERAYAALNAAVDDLGRRAARGQLAILDVEEWYARAGGSARGVAEAWLEAKARALSGGFRGLRLTGNTAFLKPREWDDFLEYERALRDAFRSQELVALCSYDSALCDADQVLDVVQAHDFALARRRGEWEVVESAALKRSKEALVRLNGELERRIGARTRELSEALAHQQLLTGELSHRVKNTIASVQVLVDQTLRRHSSLEQARAAVAGRLAAFGHVHDRLAATDWKGVDLREVLSTVLAPYLDRVRMEGDEAMLRPRAALDLALVLHELTTNAVKYGALGSGGGEVAIAATPRPDAGAPFELSWQETGGPPVEPPAAEGFGLQLIRRLLAHDLRGGCTLDYAPAGFACRLEAPAEEVLVQAAGCGAHGLR